VNAYHVPRSLAHLTHRKLRQEILQALEPILFEPLNFDHAAEKKLEAGLAAAVGRKHTLTVNSATSGLFLALVACGIGAGDEVITVGNSDISTTAAISHCGARPVFCDICANDFTIDTGLVEALITPCTKAILPVDLYGHPADVKTLRALADRFGLKIIEDAALAMGARDHGQPVGTFADAIVFSFGTYKPVGSLGNGGMVATDDDQIAERLQLYRGYGRPPKDTVEPGNAMYHQVEGYNLSLDPLQAAIVQVKLPFLEQWTRRRREIAAIYTTGLEGTSVTLPASRASAEPLFHSYVIRTARRDEIHRELRRQGVETALHYWPPILQQPVYQNGDYSTGPLAVTNRVAQEFICLPTPPELSDGETQFVVDTLKSLLSDLSILHQRGAEC
jgi:dTDP-4-amino-4,6-dideoxygalactose transaminase